jgi:hypothetical protein
MRANLVISGLIALASFLGAGFERARKRRLERQW